MIDPTVPPEATLDLAGTSGPVSVVVRELPVRQTPSGYRYAYPDFGADLIEAIWRQLPRATKSRIPWKNEQTCHRCGSRLAGDETSSSVSTAISLGRIPSFEMEWRVPGVRCPGCNSFQMLANRELDFHLSQALVVAMDAARLKPG